MEFICSYPTIDIDTDIDIHIQDACTSLESEQSLPLSPSAVLGSCSALVPSSLSSSPPFPWFSSGSASAPASAAAVSTAAASSPGSFSPCVTSFSWSAGSVAGWPSVSSAS